MHAKSLMATLQNEREAKVETSEKPSSKQGQLPPSSPAKRMALNVAFDFICLSDVTLEKDSSSLNLASETGSRQVLLLPPCELDVRLFHPPHGLPPSLETFRVYPRYPSSEPGELGRISISVNDDFLEFTQALAHELAAEFLVEKETTTPAATSRASQLQPKAAGCQLPRLLGEEFRYLFLADLCICPLPFQIDVLITKPLYLSFSGLAVTFPQVHLTNVATTSFVLGQELIAHCIAFLLLNSPALLGSCDMLGNPVQALRHLRQGMTDLSQRPLREGFFSFTSHLFAASLSSLSAVSNSVRRNLWRAPPRG